MENIQSHFKVIDVETANADFSSICQIGIAEFKNGELINKWETLVNPEDFFDSLNSSIHGITSQSVQDAPTLPEINSEIRKHIDGNIVFHHMPFDKIALNRAYEKYQLEKNLPTWIDSAKLVRRTLSQFSKSGYGLKNVTAHYGISFNHHDALEDAIATGKMVLKILEEYNLTVEECISKVNNSINVYRNGSSNISLTGNPDGPLFGENIVFTGSLFLTRAEAGKMAAELGCNVTNSVSKKTTILIVGTQDNFKLNGYKKSSKHRKAEELLLQGIDLKIMSEDDFRNLVNA
ncbi:exonuclease domain-containing protein [Christiangramia sp.]|uniref:exonuclease domain-containing protein n=1 Tax=Christiangramia sp. TaxID=1931228 RepID=UPI00261773A1|nr:exonuclease domain-containing protein [Christiangramia sp.]